MAETTRVGGVRSSLVEMRAAIERLETDFATYKKEELARRDKERDERKKDRRWTVGTVIACFAALVPIILLAVDKI